MAGHEIENEMGDWRLEEKDKRWRDRGCKELKINTESEGVVAWNTSKESEEKEKGGIIDVLRNVGINLRKIEAAENGRGRGKGARCLIFNRIIFPCFPFIYLIFPHIYSYVNAGCVPAENHIGVPR